jgi:hypothetical protein
MRAGSAVLVTGCLVVGLSAYAAEHGGQEHGGQEQAGQEHGGETHEHGGEALQAQPSAEEIRDRIAAYVQERESAEGAFTITDEVSGSTRTLTLVRVHDRVGKTGDLYYSCTDMQDTATGELLDLDFDVEAKDGALNVVDTRIHKVSGKERYTYDASDNRIPAL